MSGRNLEFGAGIWLFQEVVDRDATGAYEPPVGTQEAIERAALTAQRLVLDLLPG